MAQLPGLASMQRSLSQHTVGTLACVWCHTVPRNHGREAACTAILDAGSLNTSRILQRLRGCVCDSAVFKQFAFLFLGVGFLSLKERDNYIFTKPKKARRDMYIIFHEFSTFSMCANQYVTRTVY